MTPIETINEIRKLVEERLDEIREVYNRLVNSICDEINTTYHDNDPQDPPER